MSQRTQRMQQIEELLADDPGDAFLRYGLAMEYASIGNDAEAARLLVLLIDNSAYVPAFLMAGQILNRLGRVDEAIGVLRRGVNEATQKNEMHAAGEMQGLLASLE